MKLAAQLNGPFLASLPALFKSEGSNLVKLPAYDRETLSPGILHIGMGNFVRSHLAEYLEDLFDMGLNHDYAMVGASARASTDTSKRDALGRQDFLYTLVERDDEQVSARIMGCVTDILPSAKHEALQEALKDPKIKIVSLTITEGGYFLKSDGSFDINHPDIVHDINNPDKPTTIMGLLVKGLQYRRQNGIQPFTVMTCDNLPHNGDTTRAAVEQLAERIDPDLAKWISENVGFPNSMVDRITPATSDAELEFLQDYCKYKDDWPVFCEPFRQWVLQDDFPQGRPEFEKVGVQFVKDVEPFEKMKIRILNGGHAALCYPAALLGVQYVHEAVEHPVIGPFLDKLEKTEIIPGVTPPKDSKETPEEYWKVIEKRFLNPTIQDTIGRNCYDGASRQPKFIIPAAADAVKAGRSAEGLALVSALWCRYCQGTTEDGTVIEPNDPIWDRLQETAKAATDDPSVWICMKDIYGDLGDNPAFAESFASALRCVKQDGVEKALLRYVKGSD